MRKHLSYPAILSILISPLAAEEYEIVPLPLNRSLSTLLYDRGVAPLYGPQGQLKKFMELNGLTEETARQLRPGHPLKLPVGGFSQGSQTDDFEVEVPQTEATHVEEPQSTFSDTTIRHLGKAALGYYIYKSDSKSGSSFSAYGPMLALDYTFEKTFSQTSISFTPHFEAFYVDKLSDSFQYNYGLELWGHKKLDNYRVGLGLTYRSLYYLYITQQEPESERYNVPGILAQVERSWNDFSASLTAGMNLADQGTDKDISASPLVRLLGQKSISEDTRVSAQVEIESRKIEEDKQMMSKLLLGIDHSF